MFVRFIHIILCIMDDLLIVAICVTLCEYTTIWLCFLLLTGHLLLEQSSRCLLWKYVCIFVAYVCRSGVVGHQVCICRYYQTAVLCDCTYLSTTIDAQEFQVLHILTVTWYVPSQPCTEHIPTKRLLQNAHSRLHRDPYLMHKVQQLLSPTFLPHEFFYLLLF